MTKEEMKQVLEKAGVKEEGIVKIQENYDWDKINDAVERASSPKEAFEKVHEFYPEVEVENLLKQMDFVQGQFEAAMNNEDNKISFELTEDELDAVVGGGAFGDWWGKNWKTVAQGAILGVFCGLVAAPFAAVVIGVSAPVAIAIGVGVAAVFIGAAVVKTIMNNK